MSVADLDLFLLVGGLVLVGAVLSIRLTMGVGFPALVVFLLIGVAMGESGLGIEFEDADLARAVSFAALVVILAEGGLSTRWREVRPVLPMGISLATVGVAITVLLMAVAARLLFDFDWTLALLLGAVFAPTDAAAVFSTLRRVSLKHRVASTLESESGLNDAPTVVLVTLLSTSGEPEHGVVGLVGIVVYELVAGGILGAVVGAAGVLLLRRVALPASGLYPLFVMTFAVLGYAVPAAVHASGFVGVYVASLILGNSDLPHRVATRSFSEGLAWLAQIGLFVMLGLLSSPGRLGPSVLTAIVAGLVLTFVARPVSVLLATLPWRLSWGERTFLSWAGLRGAIPVVLATIPLSEDVPGATRLFDVVFVFVLVFTLLQAPPLPWLADRLGVSSKQEPRDVEMEVAPLERLGADLVQVRVTSASRMHGVEIRELRLPRGASVSLIVRGDETLVPSPSTTLKHGDELLVVTPRALREKTEERLRMVSRRGRLATWLSRSDDDEPD